MPIQTVAPPTTTYPNFGATPVKYYVKLIASRADGCDSVITKAFTVYPEPKPSFFATPPVQYLPDNTVSVTNTTPALTSLEGDWNYEWDFGDGSPVEYTRDPDPHVYGGIGKYNITLTISNKYCKGSVTKEVALFAKKPIADFDPGQITGCKPLVINFINKSLYADSTKYEWDFGDGEGRSTLVNPTYSYAEPGEYSVRLIARNSEGVPDDTVKIDMIKVYDIPHASFEARPYEVHLPDKPVYLTNKTLGGDSYLWDFGDGSTSTETSPAHIYLDSGTFIVKLIAYNKDGCSDTAFIKQPVKAIFGGRVLIPNAFTPNLAALGINSSEDNDYFFPVAEGVVSIDLKVFNRWGEIMYRTTNKDAKGWDGYFNGKLCTQDVYIYTITMKFSDGYIFNKTGDVVLLR